MVWLFLLALAAWIAYRAAALTDFENSPRVAWWSVIVAGLALVFIAGNFAFMEGPFPILPLSWEAADGTKQTAGVGTPVVLTYNVFALLGPIGNAVFWGSLALLLLRKAWDGGWYRGALTLRQIAVEDANKGERNEQKSRTVREYRDTQRRLCFERTGAMLGRWLGRLVRGRRA